MARSWASHPPGETYSIHARARLTKQPVLQPVSSSAWVLQRRKPAPSQRAFDSSNVCEGASPSKSRSPLMVMHRPSNFRVAWPAWSQQTASPADRSADSSRGDPQASKREGSLEQPYRSIAVSLHDGRGAQNSSSRGDKSHSPLVGKSGKFSSKRLVSMGGVS